MTSIYSKFLIFFFLASISIAGAPVCTKSSPDRFSPHTIKAQAWKLVPSRIWDNEVEKHYDAEPLDLEVTGTTVEQACRNCSKAKTIKIKVSTGRLYDRDSRKSFCSQFLNPQIYFVKNFGGFMRLKTETQNIYHADICWSFDRQGEPIALVGKRKILVATVSEKAPFLLFDSKIEVNLEHTHQWCAEVYEIFPDWKDSRFSYAKVSEKL